jgi:hypothetical protein
MGVKKSALILNLFQKVLESLKDLCGLDQHHFEIPFEFI